MTGRVFVNHATGFNAGSAPKVNYNDDLCFELGYVDISSLNHWLKMSLSLHTLQTAQRLEVKSRKKKYFHDLLMLILLGQKLNKILSLV